MATVMAMLLGGCVQPPPPDKLTATPPEPIAGVDHMIVEITPPMPINMDDVPGPDGLQARVYFFQNGRNLPVTVSGNLEMSLYEEVAAASNSSQLTAREPMRTWTFNASELNQRLIRTIIGYGYMVRLNWGSQPPIASKITLVGRYRLPNGQYLLSDPVTIPVVLK